MALIELPVPGVRKGMEYCRPELVSAKKKWNHQYQCCLILEHPPGFHPGTPGRFAQPESYRRFPEKSSNSRGPGGARRRHYLSRPRTARCVSDYWSARRQDGSR